MTTFPRTSQPLPTPATLLQEFPLSFAEKQKVLADRKTLRSILRKEDPRLLLIVGPCSIHDLDSTYAYAERLYAFSQKVADRFFIVMRTFLEKPRTTVGWKGFLYDPHLDGSYAIESGLRLSRELLITLVKMGLPIGGEMLEISTAPYFSDLFSWGCIGARTTTSQPHRQLAASLPFPIGFKNTTEGNVDHAIHGILTAAKPHNFLGINQTGQLSHMIAQGNTECHLILRGGERKANFSPHDLRTSAEKCLSAGITPSLIVDCSHDNCHKQHERQKVAFQSVMQQLQEGNDSIVGTMIESHLFEGNQKASPSPHYGISVTDPCLSWEATQEMIEWAYQIGYAFSSKDITYHNTRF